MHKDFKIIATLTKAYKSDDGRLFVEGIASNTDLDLTGERMDRSAIQAMATALKAGAVELRSEHSDRWDDVFGEVVELSVTDNDELFYKAELDAGFSKSHDLMHAINKGAKLGVSIGGTVAKAGMRWAEELGRAVYTYFDIALKEISVTSSPAVPDTWIGRITRSINRNEVTMHENAQPQPTKVEVEVETPTPTTTPAPEVEQPAPAEAPTNDTSVPEGQPVDKTEDPEGETPPAPASDENAAAAQVEEEAGDPADAPSDPPQTDAPASDTPSEETQKSRYLGEWADSAIGMSAIYTGYEQLTYALYGLLDDSNKPTAEKLTTATAMFDEYRDISLKILRTVLEGSADDAAKSLEALKAPKREELTKALTAKDEELTTLQKSLQETTAMVKVLEEENTKIKARKVLVFGKGYELAPEETTKSEEDESIGTFYLQKIGALDADYHQKGTTR